MPDETLTITKRMRSFLDNRRERDPYRLATQFIRGCDKEDLLPLLANEFWRLIRSDVRSAEVRALTGGQAKPRIVEAATLGELAELLDKPYRIGDGTPSQRFRDMTIADHKNRIEMLNANIEGMKRSRDLHLEAIRILTKHGADTLAELENQEVAA